MSGQSSLWQVVDQQNLQIPDVSLGYHDHDFPLGRGKSVWSEFRSRGYLPNHAIAAVKSYLYIPRKYRIKNPRFPERIGHPLFYYEQAARHIGPLHGPWYINRFNRQIAYGEETYERNLIQPDPMLGFATRHPMLWGEEHLRIRHAERSIQRKRHFNDYMNKLTVHCFDTCINREDFTLHNYELNEIEGRCVRQCFRRTIDAKTMTMSQTMPGSASFLV